MLDQCTSGMGDHVDLGCSKSDGHEFPKTSDKTKNDLRCLISRTLDSSKCLQNMFRGW